MLWCNDDNVFYISVDETSFSTIMVFVTQQDHCIFPLFPHLKRVITGDLFHACSKSN